MWPKFADVGPPDPHELEEDHPADVGNFGPRVVNYAAVEARGGFRRFTRWSPELRIATLTGHDTPIGTAKTYRKAVRA